MPQRQQTALKPTYVRPITCKCGGNAHLVRRRLHPLKSRSGTELRTFQCHKCRDLTEMTVESLGWLAPKSPPQYGQPDQAQAQQPPQSKLEPEE